MSQCGRELKQIALKFRHNAAAVLEEADRWKPVSAPPPEAGECVRLECTSGPTNMAMAFLANPPVSLPAGVSSTIALYNAGKAADAVEQLSAWLSEHAGCAEGWFWKGVMLSDMASTALAAAWRGEHGHEVRDFMKRSRWMPSRASMRPCRLNPVISRHCSPRPALLARIAQETDARSQFLCAAAVEHMRDEQARARYVQPHVARFYLVFESSHGTLRPGRRYPA